MTEHYLMSSSLHKLREEAIEHAINFYYQKQGTEINLDHLAEHGAVTNYSDGRFDFAIGSDLLVSFGPVEYHIDYERGGVIMLCRQDIEEHYINIFGAVDLAES
jgi:hypothetical protein